MNIHTGNNFAMNGYESQELIGCVFENAIERKLHSPTSWNSRKVTKGDAKKEYIRRQSFRNFPTSIGIDPHSWARAGFYYTQTEDLVQCFSCSNTISAQAHSNPFDTEMHRFDCVFRTCAGQCSGNIPITVPAEHSLGNQGASISLSTGECPEDLADRTSSSSLYDIHYQSAQPYGIYPVTPPTPPEAHGDPVSSPLFRRSVLLSHEQLIQTLNLAKESDRLRSFQSWPNSRSKPDAEVLAHDGFFYLGNLDRTKCFSCDGTISNWKSTDNVTAVHLHTFCNCKMALGQEPQNIADVPAFATSSMRDDHEENEMSPEMRRRLRETFPCVNPLTPQMQNFEDRLNTFADWKFTRISPRIIAESGFFCRNTRDRTTCFYCNGGLQNWRFYDNPWNEHAKWYPDCEYLLQRKGPDFVNSVVARYPNLKGSGSSSHSTGSSSVTTSSTRANETVRLSKEKMKILNDSMESDIAKAIVGMGYDVQHVREVMKRQIHEKGAPYQTASTLLDAVLAYDAARVERENAQRLEESRREASAAASSARSAASQTSVETSTSTRDTEEITKVSLQKRLEEVLDERQCKVCLDATADIVFIPCGHICCCIRCARSLSNCPICRQRIHRVLRTFIA